MTAELQLEQVSKRYPTGVRAVDQVSFTVAAGEYLALIGPSGCGKTTLLRLISGIAAVSAGDIRIDQKSVISMPLYERDVAMMFQHPALAIVQSVRNNLRWAWTLREPLAGIKRWFGGDRVREAKLLEIARMLDLEKDLDRPVQQLSGGQQQRVALGRCLLRQAKICLLDEPLGHLDAPLRTDLRRQMRSALRQQGLTVVHVTHDPDEACAVGDRVAVMQAGRIVQLDTPTQLLRSPQNRFVAEVIHQAFGGLNVLSGVIRREDMDTYFDGVFGRWPMLALMLTQFHEALAAGSAQILLGIPARAVRASSERCEDADLVQLTLPALQEECTSAGTWIVAGDERGHWIGQSAGEHFRPGQSVTMTFAMEQAYWFEHATGRTLLSPSL
jgi:ABC-type sugar transport system ATPase subunit